MSSAPSLAETRIAGEEVYAGRFFRVLRDRVRLPDGREAVREYVRHPGAVAIVPVHEDGRVLLVRQHRYPLGRDFLEVPAGKLERAESHLETARRELAEETGCSAREWRRLGLIHNAVGYSDEAIELWLAQGLVCTSPAPEAGEFLQPCTLPLEEALAMCRDGRITDVKTIVGLLWAEPLLRPR